MPKHVSNCRHTTPRSPIPMSYADSWWAGRSVRLDRRPAAEFSIGAAYFFTSSTSFANPAITIGRMFSDTFAGIAPSSAPGFITAQLIGGAVGFALVHLFYPVHDHSAGSAAVLLHQATVDADRERSIQ